MDGRPDRRNKATLLHFSDIVWALPKTLNQSVILFEVARKILMT